MPTLYVVVGPYGLQEHAPAGRWPGVGVDPRALDVRGKHFKLFCVRFLFEPEECVRDAVRREKWQGHELSEELVGSLILIVCCSKAKFLNLE